MKTHRRQDVANDFLSEQKLQCPRTQLCHHCQELLRIHLEVKIVISNLRELHEQHFLQVFVGVMYPELMRHLYINYLALIGESLKDHNQNDHRLA